MMFGDPPQAHQQGEDVHHQEGNRTIEQVFALIQVVLRLAHRAEHRLARRGSDLSMRNLSNDSSQVVTSLFESEGSGVVTERTGLHPLLPLVPGSATELCPRAHERGSLDAQPLLSITGFC